MPKFERVLKCPYKSNVYNSQYFQITKVVHLHGKKLKGMTNDVCRWVIKLTFSGTSFTTYLYFILYLQIHSFVSIQESSAFHLKTGNRWKLDVLKFATNQDLLLYKGHIQKIFSRSFPLNWLWHRNSTSQWKLNQN